jgi:tRNA(fMet)-specific endonuclease VapC
VTLIYMIDTNTVSYIINGRSKEARRQLDKHLAETVISAVTEGELRYGLARKPEAHKLKDAVEAFLGVVKVLPWDSEAAESYGSMRAHMTAAGKSLSPLDMLIAAHAAALGATFVTADGAFAHAEGLRARVNWARDL